MAEGVSVFLLPLNGIEEWDRPGQPLHDPEGLGAFVESVRESVHGPTELVELPCHINDPAFVAAALGIFDRWVMEGRIPAGSPL